MDEVIRDILARLRAEADGGPTLDGRGLARLLDERNRREGGPRRRYVKKALLPFYLRVRDEDPERWRAWDVDEALEERLVALLRMKPRRTASGVATVTVITKPWPCAGGCLFCPNDVRMPKSYLADEPACQRAERAFFDPYVQVSARLRTLAQMGHPVDKVELIVLGGTWSDYPAPYRRWFVAELFRALNDGVTSAAEARASERRAGYEALGIPAERADCAAFAAEAQRAVDAGRLSYNQAVRALYGAGRARSAGDAAADAGGAAGADAGAWTGARACADGAADAALGARFDADGALGVSGASSVLGASASPWARAAAFQEASWDEVEAAQRANEGAACRCVGLVVETRPELADAAALVDLRRLGCTKVQVGVQSLDPAVLAASGRGDAGTVDAVARAFALMRLLGFKIHAHFMANLPGATPEADARDYRRLVADGRFLPDEVKLYPCVLTAATPLAGLHEAGEWEPYDEESLVALLAADVRATPPFTRISRMIRDISAHDIVAGNRKTNLRQLVDRRITAEAEEGATAGAEPLGGNDAGEDGKAAAAAASPLAGEAAAGAAGAGGPAGGALRGEETDAPDAKALGGAGDAAGPLGSGAAFPVAAGELAGKLRADGDVASVSGAGGPVVQEIRSREIAGDEVDEAALRLDVVPYDTAVSRELFLQWVTPEGRIAGFLRLSLPRPEALAAHPMLPVGPGEAMIREVHVYGRTSPLARTVAGVQHRGLGRRLVEEACARAAAAGYGAVNVISAVGTRDYYRHLGFEDAGLYQRRVLGDVPARSGEAAGVRAADAGPAASSSAPRAVAAPGAGATGADSSRVTAPAAGEGASAPSSPVAARCDGEGSSSASAGEGGWR